MSVQVGKSKRKFKKLSENVVIKISAVLKFFLKKRKNVKKMSEKRHINIVQIHSLDLKHNCFYTVFCINVRKDTAES